MRIDGATNLLIGSASGGEELRGLGEREPRGRLGGRAAAFPNCPAAGD